MSKRSTLEERFWSKVDRSGECWLWTGEVNNRGGYGRIRVDGRRRLAHRVAYELCVGPIPEGLQIDHRCHQPACVRPDHLRPVTPKQNGENRAGAARQSGSGVRGTYWHSRFQRWTAQVGHHGRHIHVGYFDSLAEAESAVVAKRRELFSHSDMDGAL